MIKTIILIIIIIFIIYYYNTFENFITDEKIIVTNYYTNWCGWSKKFSSEWNTFKNIISDNKNISTVDVMCDDPNNHDKCINVPGFPYVVINKNNKNIPYDGERKADKILNYINNLQS